MRSRASPQPRHSLAPMRRGNNRGIRPDDRAVIHCVGRGRRPMAAFREHGVVSARIVLMAVAAAWLAGVGGAAVWPDLPGPLDGPGHPELKRRDAKRIEKAVRELAAGDVSAAAKAAGKADDSPARRLIDLQIRMAESTEPPVEELRQLCADRPDYAAAWAHSRHRGGAGRSRGSRARRRPACGRALAGLTVGRGRRRPRTADDPRSRIGGSNARRTPASRRPPWSGSTRHSPWRRQTTTS